MNLGFAVISLRIAACYCYVAYEMFQGFDVTPATANRSTEFVTLVTATVPVSSEGTPRINSSVLVTELEPQEEETTTQVQPITSSKFKCPEEEEPSNIGAYEVPTHRDIVLLVKKTLKRMFNTYHEKALYFLNDIKEATKATSVIERRCRYSNNRASYRKCVRQVSIKCEIITKGLVTSLESQRRGVEAFTNGTVCNVKGIKTDPIELIKTLAMEEASLDFALPGFLRLLSACSIYCDKTEPQQTPQKPLRHMTDQDLVVKHFLTKKSYIQLIKGSK